MISGETVGLLIRAILDGESDVCFLDRPVELPGTTTTFAVVGGLFHKWRLTWHHDKPYGFVALVESDVNQIGGFDDWTEVERENPVDDLIETEYKRFVSILSNARKFTGF